MSLYRKYIHLYRYWANIAYIFRLQHKCDSVTCIDIVSDFLSLSTRKQTRGLITIRFKEDGEPYRFL